MAEPVSPVAALEAMALSPTGMKRKRDKHPNTPLKKARQDIELDSDSDFAPYGEEIEEVGFKTVDTPPTPISRPSSARPKKYICNYSNCNKAYARPKALEEHIRSHTNERPYECVEPDCHKTFRREDHLRRHIQIAHKNERNYKCPWEDCDRSFCDSAKLKTHIAVHEGREKFKCTGYEGCNEWFRKRETLRAHVVTVHLKQKPYPCDEIDPDTGNICKSGFPTALKLADHKKRAHGPPRFACQICHQEQGPSSGESKTAVFMTYSALQAHIQITHPPICKQCGRTFVTPKSLTQHIELAHSTSDNLDERRTFQCNYEGCHGIVSHGFTRKSNLTAHIRQVHERLRPFICGQTDLSRSKKCLVDGKPWDGAGACGKACQTKFHLEEHVRTAHLGLEWMQITKKRARGEASSLESPRSKNNDLTTFSKLTGHGYGVESGRDIECLISKCPFRFFREHDLQVHCQSTHGMAEVEYAEAARELGLPFANNFVAMMYDDEKEMSMRLGLPSSARMNVRTGEVDTAPLVNKSVDATFFDRNEMWLNNDGEEDSDALLSRLLGSDSSLDPLLLAHDANEF